MLGFSILPRSGLCLWLSAQPPVLKVRVRQLFLFTRVALLFPALGEEFMSYLAMFSSFIFYQKFSVLSMFCNLG